MVEILKVFQSKLHLYSLCSEYKIPIAFPLLKLHYP